MPRSSAKMGTAPRRCVRASNSSSPGPARQVPSIAVSLVPSMHQYPAKPRKWSIRVSSYSCIARPMREAHQA